jgi:hypothetical protein
VWLRYPKTGGFEPSRRKPPARGYHSEANRGEPDRLLLAVQELLFREWDPIGVNDGELCRYEYDSYAPTICRWLREGSDEFKLANHLSQLQRVSMGMSTIDEELHRRVGRWLLELVS